MRGPDSPPALGRFCAVRRLVPLMVPYTNPDRKQGRLRVRLEGSAWSKPFGIDQVLSRVSRCRCSRPRLLISRSLDRVLFRISFCIIGRFRGSWPRRCCSQTVEIYISEPCLVLLRWVGFLLYAFLRA